MPNPDSEFPNAQENEVPALPSLDEFVEVIEMREELRTLVQRMPDFFEDLLRTDLQIVSRSAQLSPEQVIEIMEDLPIEQCRHALEQALILMGQEQRYPGLQDANSNN